MEGEKRMATKDELDGLIKKAGIGKRTAKKLHEANGTSEESTPETRRTGGTGSSTIQLPNFDSEL